MRRIVILGSTGSIGTQALDVVGRSGELEVVGLAAASSWEPLLEQAKALGVERIALADPDAAARASERWTAGEVLAGAEGLVELITETGCDLVLNALVGLRRARADGRRARRGHRPRAGQQGEPRGGRRAGHARSRRPRARSSSRSTPSTRPSTS